MIARSFEISEGLQLIELAAEQAPQAMRTPGAIIWVDLQDPEPAALESWLASLGVEGLTRRLCLEARDRPGFYPLKNEMFLVIPVLLDAQDAPDVDQLAIVCRENLFLTLHRKVAFHESEAEALDAKSWLPGRSVAALLCAVLIDRSQDSLRHTAALRDSIRALEDLMDDAPDTVEAGAIRDRRAELLALDAAVGDQLPVVSPLSATERPYFKLEGARDYMNCVLANLQAANAALGRLEQRIEALRAGFQMHAQDKTNRRLGVLTVLSAIFMPITLLAGIWGMNFENMPELKYAFGYPVALGLMVGIGAGMVLFFRKRGWFD